MYFFLYLKIKENSQEQSSVNINNKDDNFANGESGGNNLDTNLGNLQNIAFSNDVNTAQLGDGLNDCIYGTQDYTYQFTNDEKIINQFKENSINNLNQYFNVEKESAAQCLIELESFENHK